MNEGDQGTRFYIRATNCIGRICVGDDLTIDLLCDIAADSIVLVAPDKSLHRAADTDSDLIIGKVVNVCIQY